MPIQQVCQFIVNICTAQRVSLLTDELRVLTRNTYLWKMVIELTVRVRQKTYLLKLFGSCRRTAWVVRELDELTNINSDEWSPTIAWTSSSSISSTDLGCRKVYPPPFRLITQYTCRWISSNKKSDGKMGLRWYMQNVHDSCAENSTTGVTGILQRF